MSSTVFYIYSVLDFLEIALHLLNCFDEVAVKKDGPYLNKLYSINHFF